MSFLDRIRKVNQYNPEEFAPFVVDGRRLGAVRKDRVATLQACSDGTIESNAGALGFSDGIRTAAERTSVIAATVERLIEAGALRGLRNEVYPAAWRFGETPQFLIDRVAVPFFGLRAWGVHLNGFVEKDDGLHLWVGRRAQDRPTYPGMLDNMVAGGQPHGIGLVDNLVKECAEEADMPDVLARQSQSVGAINYVQQSPDGLKPDVMFCFDLEVPADFIPRNTDGEIDAFHLWPIDEVAKVVAETGDFKDNCNLVIIDFLIRRGIIPPEHPDFVELLQGLHP